MVKMVIASGNAGKIRELNARLAELKVVLIPQGELGVSDIEETGLSFIENAILKARHASSVTGLPALADDSGLVVDALQGAPGIHTARYAGPHANNVDNIRKLLTALRDVPENQRGAEFHCVLAFVSHAKDPAPLVCEGKWQGRILTSPTGQDGFGYDPIFYVPSEKKSAAELSIAIKNKISHRGIALQSLIAQLPDKLHECVNR
jgi:XTP/dITP diphosphohydrolase